MAGSADRRYEEALRLLSQAASILKDRSGIEPTSTNPVAPNIVEDTNVAVPVYFSPKPANFHESFLLRVGI